LADRFHICSSKITITDDDTIPIRMGRELAEDFPALVTFYPVVVGDHVSVIDKASPEIVSAMNE
jgi:hypothetical protein